MSASRAKSIVVQKKPRKAKSVSVRQKKAVPVSSKKLVLTAHSDDKNTKIQITNKVNKEKKVERTLAKPIVTTIAVQSPYRFPLPRTQSLALVARIAGLCFVVTGALLSMMSLHEHKNVLSVAETQRAETMSATQTQQQVVFPNGEAVQITPLDISISLPSNTVQGITPVTISAAAERVDVYAQGASGSKMKLGSAKRTDTPIVWDFSWDTRRVNDGTYTLSVIASVNGTTHEKKYDTAVLVKNTAQQVMETAEVPKAEESNQVTNPNTTLESESEVEEQVSTTTTSTEAESETKTEEVPAESSKGVTLSAPGGSLEGEVLLKVKVAAAQSVRVSAYNTETGVLYQAGIAQKVTDTEWKLYWNTVNVVSGTYQLIASAVIQSKEYESAKVKVAVQNKTYVKPSVATTTTILEEQVKNEPLEPTIVLNVPKQNPLSGYVDIGITADSAISVELYRQPVQSLSPSFVGKARRIDATRWVYSWNTSETPNGDYYLFANVTNAYGTTASSKTRLQVKNMILDTFTAGQAEKIDVLTKANTEFVKPVDSSDLPSNPEGTPPKTVYIEPVDIFLTSISTDEEAKVELAGILARFRTELDSLINTLGQALRKNDTEGITNARAAIEALKETIRAEVPEGDDKEMILDRVSTYLDRTARELDALVVRNDTLLKERVGDAVMNDSDKDGISDYDEIHLYQTNPFTADTDGDGFIDSVEITQGYDPHDSRSESVITYESPQEIGLVREDLLRIDSVSSLKFESPDEGPKVQALFSGAGLPNSFVTLYIYSTPIIVTVKTDAEGNWNYMLDKDLEDGDHEIYIGMTDNAGRLVAKSSPLPFVKTAEAYTAGAIASANEGEGAPTFMGINTMLFASSFIVLVLGLVLLLIGTFAQPRIREEKALIAPAS